MFAEREEDGHLGPLRGEAGSDIPRQVREYLEEGQLAEASRLLAGARELYPNDLILEAVSVAENAAQRKPAKPAAAPPIRRISPLTFIAVVLLILAVGGLLFFARGGDRRVTSQEDAARNPVSAASPDARALQEAALLAIKDHSWEEAGTWVARLSELKPGEPRLKEWVAQIDQGSAGDRRIADLRSAALAAIGARNWNEAETRIRLLLKEVPGDPDGLQWRRLLANGRSRDLLASETVTRNKKIGAVRASIQSAIEAKRWNEAQQRITDLQQLAPNDPEAAAWPKALAILRMAGLTASADPAQNISEPNGDPPTNSPAAGANANAGLTARPALPLPVETNTPGPARLTTANETLQARIEAISGRWAYLDPHAPEPQKTTKALFSDAELVSLDVDPNGPGELVYTLKKSAPDSASLDGASVDGTSVDHTASVDHSLDTVQFHFRLKDWDGKRLSGLSDSTDRDYSITIEPANDRLNLEWTLLTGPGRLDRRPATAGRAMLTKGRKR